MAESFTAYWTPAGWANLKEGDPIVAAASNMFHKRGVEPGATLYIVNVIDGEMRLLGRFSVSEIVSKREATRRLGRGIWDANEVALAAPNSSVPLELRMVPKSHLARLRFETADGVPKAIAYTKSGEVDRQTLRGIRRQSTR